MDIFQKCDGFTRAQELHAAGLYAYFIPLAGSEGTEVEIGGRRLIMIGSNNYLGLTHHEHVRQAAIDAVRRYGTSCSGSRFLNGTLELHEELERRLAAFMGMEATLCFSTGFQTNLGAISAICGKDDLIFCDRENHASIIDGCRLSFAEVRKFRHNDMVDLESQLQRANNRGGKLIIVDGLFSMMGDLAPLQQIRELADRYGARLMVDEAHSMGVLGHHGRGAAEHCGIEADLVMGTFSKSFASLGGFIAGPKRVIEFMKHQARPLIFSAAIAPPSAAAALAALDLIEARPDMRRRVLQIAHRVRTGLREMGFQTAGTLASPIVPVIVGHQERMLHLWRALFECGLFTNAVTQPAVPVGQDLIRTSFIASHTDAQIDEVLQRFAEAGRKVGMLGADADSSATPPAQAAGQ
ncbi:MAG: pyridoxal phosphate-dependent aminotransferase family protein [Planctomycetes bacterium]|nr:pyridoxal phosphate-dependent aminotransferase family protein [Planctomycetota bacterium]MCB9887658.1 pyridoxal phosphate-dependent aminotransferase family protein [Planctomycetota bacterium]